MALYEHVFIYRQDLTTLQTEDLIKQYSDILKDNGGKVIGHEYWGLRTLAYKINKNRYQSIILKRFERLLGFQAINIVHQNIHGWKYAYNKSKTPLDFIWNKNKKLGICGDWFVGSKAEDAWISANDLYNSIETKKPSIRKY